MVGFEVGDSYYEVGSGDFLHAFFSTVAYRLEGGRWGSRFPLLMNELYQGELSSEKAENVLKDIPVIRRELRNFPPETVVWDIENLSKQPPWGNDISSDIHDLSDYFVTSEGCDLIGTLARALRESRDSGFPLIIT